jgi:hypothetical protein
MNGKQGSAIVRVAAVIGMVCMAGFCFMLFLIRSPKALPVSAIILVPLGVEAVWLATGTFTINLVPLFRRLKGWKLGVAVALCWLLFLYTAVCLWWLLSGVR